MSKKRHAFVGTGGRALSFIEPLVTTYGEQNELVGICDLSPARMAYYNELLVRARHRLTDLDEQGEAHVHIRPRAFAPCGQRLAFDLFQYQA